MSFHLPTFDPDDLIVDSQKMRAQWDREFEKNYRGFARCLAIGIAGTVIRQLENILNDHFQKVPSQSDKFQFSVSLDITSCSGAKRMMELMEENKLAPFNDWLYRFSNIEQGTAYVYKVQELNVYYDRAYFQERMAIVGRLIEETLSSEFYSYSKVPRNKNLEFRVKWQQPTNGFFSRSGAFCGSDNTLYVHSWVKDKVEQQPEPPTDILKKPDQNYGAMSYRKKLCGLVTFVILALFFTCVLATPQNK